MLTLTKKDVVKITKTNRNQSTYRSSTDAALINELMQYRLKRSVKDWELE